MVKVGFIVEGASERIVLKSNAFQVFLQTQGIQPVGDIIDMAGKGNLRQSNTRMNSQVQLLRELGAKWIVVLRDHDGATSFSAVKAEVFQSLDVCVCIAVQELEAWFLADHFTLLTLLQINFCYLLPETVFKPTELLSAFRLEKTGRGIKDKKLFARQMIGHGFTIQQAARHPNCPSAGYFLSTLQILASAN